MKRILDLYCKAGGAAKGYADAGFIVDGVDIEPQKRYPYRFIQSDAIEYALRYGHLYDAIHASPPCQAYSALGSVWPGREWQDWIPQTREVLRSIGKPYVIENVPGAPLCSPIVLCGSMFGLQTKCGAQLRRHRLFETNWQVGEIPACKHGSKTIGIHGSGNRQGSRVISIAGGVAEDRAVARIPGTRRKVFSRLDGQYAMGIDWMTMKELSQAIPPAYTRFIGSRLIEVLR